MCMILKEPGTKIKVYLAEIALTWLLHECVPCLQSMNKTFSHFENAEMCAGTAIC